MFFRLMFSIFLTASLLASESFAGDTPIHSAAEKGDLSKVRRLVKSGVDINLKDQDKKTPLQRAYENEHRWLAQWLIDHGAQVFARDFKPLRKLKVRIKSFNDPPKKKKKGSVYDDIARATGGAVYQFDKGKMDGMADIMTAQLGARTLLNREIELNGKERVALKLEPGWTSAIFSVTAIGRKPKVEVQGPSRKKVKAIGANKIIPLKNGSVTIVDNPDPGTWVVIAEGKGNLHIKVEAKTSRTASAGSRATGKNKAEIYKIEFVDLGGRPGHQGYFASRRALVPKEERMVKAVVYGDLTDVRLFLLKRNGNPVAGTGNGFKPVVPDGDDYFFKVRVPREAFRMKIEGKGAEGVPVALVYKPLFDPDLNLAIFSFKPEGRMDIDDCVLAQSYLQVMKSDTATVSALVTCEVGRGRLPKLKFGMRLYIPPSKQGAKKVVFFPDPRYKYGESQCAQMKKFLGKFSKRAQVYKSRAGWHAECSSSNDKPRLEIHVRIEKEN